MGGNRSKSPRFPDTRWSVIGRAEASDDMVREQAIAELLAIYTPALQRFLVASRRVPPDLAKDLVHDFVADKVLGRKLLHHVDQAKGKFRNYLLKAFNNFVTTKLKREYTARAMASGADVSVVEDPTSHRYTDQFDWEWVQQVVRDALDLMKADCIDRGRSDLWDIFSFRVVEPLLNAGDALDYGEVVKRLHIQTPREAMNLLATAKRCFLRHLRTAIGRYVHGSDRVDIEIADLRAIVGR